jgi:hypothetical protein
MDNWIDCRVKLPEYGVPVLLVYSGIVQDVLYVRDVGEFRAMCDEDTDPMPEKLATHWMYKPEPPEMTK